ncbi:MAG: tRNA 2-thiouridine(34) synthase MnmA [Flavobacteriaceae bacterium]|nr:tRNA 2-thiouridine(34) synthase MnmA [Flavobacteriaceae bacterium]
MAKVVVGLSGGVDSSVAAYLLKEQGHEVIGLFMKNWHDTDATISDECPWLEDSNDAMLVAQKLGIPFQSIDLSRVYRERIVDYMFREYQAGRTPNPDVLCNREIKFDVFLDLALSLGADVVATGHYCRKATAEIEGKTVYRLLSGKDANKDQSYFLCQINQQQLSKILFPIGELQKHEVRKIAAEQGLITAEKKDSQGLCFIGKVKLPDFLKQQLKPKTGEVHLVLPEALHLQQLKVEVSDQLPVRFDFSKTETRIIGEHQGAHFYTIGQRKGLGIGGFKEPLFILATDTQTNRIYVGESKAHPGLYRRFLWVSEKEIHWVREDLALKPGESLRVTACIRYRQTPEKAILYRQAEGLLVGFDQEQFAIASGQFVAWYHEDELIGSGVIDGA